MMKSISKSKSIRKLRFVQDIPSESEIPEFDSDELDIEESKQVTKHGRVLKQKKEKQKKEET